GQRRSSIFIDWAERTSIDLAGNAARTIRNCRFSRPVSTYCHMPRSKSCPFGTWEFDMSDMALPGSIEPALRKGPDLDKGFHPLTGIIYMGVVAAALLFVAYSIYSDVDATGTPVG